MKKKVRILSIDGGGMRGVIPATILKYAEDYLQAKVPGTTIADHFDFIAGTSTGGILTCIYLTPQDDNKDKAKFSAEDALNFYKDEGYNIFNASKKSEIKRLWGLRNATEYSPKYIEKSFIEKFGNNLMTDLMKPCMITSNDMKSKSAVFFTSFDDVKRNKFYVRDVTRSTSAAPTYFPPAMIKNHALENDDAYNQINIDGGVFANNPLMCAYAEARKFNFEERNNNKPDASSMYILSLGTGGGGFKLKNEGESKRWSLLSWAKSIPEIMMDGSIDTVAFQMKKISESLPEDAIGDYLRIDVPKDKGEEKITYSSDMSNASSENVTDLISAGKKTLDNAIKNQKLNEFLDGLL